MTKPDAAAFQPSPWPLPAGGHRVLIPAERIRETEADKRISALHLHGFGFYPQARGHTMSRRQHQDTLVIYCVEGRGSCALADQHHEIGAGDLLVLEAGTAHRYEADPKTPWSIFWMHLGGTAVPDWLRGFTRQSPVTRIGLYEHLVQDFRALLDSTASGYRMENLLLAASLAQQFLASATVLANRHVDQEETQLARLHAFMDTHLDTRLTLADLQAVYGVRSRYQFIRQYKARTGQTPIQAFLHRKVSHACYLLETTSLPVASIARALGFDDPYYFSRAFTRIVGLSPARYRDRGGR